MDSVICQSRLADSNHLPLQLVESVSDYSAELLEHQPGSSNWQPTYFQEEEECFQISTLKIFGVIIQPAQIMPSTKHTQLGDGCEQQ
jgi:hypothetical protein